MSQKLGSRGAADPGEGENRRRVNWERIGDRVLDKDEVSLWEKSLICPLAGSMYASLS